MNKNDIYYMFDKPIPLSNEKNIFLFPVLMSDYIEFHLYIDCLMIDKNSIPDANIIRMSYLEYLCNISDNKNYLLPKLIKILSMSTKISEKKIYIDKNNNGYFINIDGFIINGSDFEDIRKTICEQNSIELEDETIQKEIRDVLKKARQFKYDMSTSKIGSLEDQIVCVLISTQMNLEDIMNLSIRKFLKILQRVDLKLHYQIYLSASLSGFVEFKDKSFIKHWMSDVDEKTNENLIDIDKIRDKIENKK